MNGENSEKFSFPENFFYEIIGNDRKTRLKNEMIFAVCFCVWYVCYFSLGDIADYL